MKTAVSIDTASPQSLLQNLDRDLSRLLAATVRLERLQATRNQEIAAIQKTHARAIEKDLAEIESLEQRIEACYVSHRKLLETEGTKCVQLTHGLLGMRAPSNPALVPLSAKWTWKQIAIRVKKLWKTKYFHAPKAPDLDKVKIKKEMTPADLTKAGLKLDDSENFYYELNQLTEPEAA